MALHVFLLFGGFFVLFVWFGLFFFGFSFFSPDWYPYVELVEQFNLLGTVLPTVHV